MVKTIKTASRGEGKTAKPDFARWKYTPFGANAPPFPRRGHFYRRYALRCLWGQILSGEQTSPSGWKYRAAGIGVHFLQAQPGRHVFLSRQRRGCMILPKEAALYDCKGRPRKARRARLKSDHLKSDRLTSPFWLSPISSRHFEQSREISRHYADCRIWEKSHLTQRPSEVWQSDCLYFLKPQISNLKPILNRIYDNLLK